MHLNVGKEVVALQRMTVTELRERYADAFGEETNVNNKAWRVKRIAWRLQARTEGDLSERARCHAAELANEAAPQGYRLVLNPDEAVQVRTIFPLYLAA